MDVIEKANKEAGEKKDNGRKESVLKFAMVDLQFSIRRVKCYLKKRMCVKCIATNASIFLVIVIEYLVAQIP